jgi:hypothetical protein
MPRSTRSKPAKATQCVLFDHFFCVLLILCCRKSTPVVNDEVDQSSYVAFYFLLCSVCEFLCLRSSPPPVEHIIRDLRFMVKL